MQKMVYFVILLFCCCIPEVYSRSHTNQYYLTLIPSPTHGVPQYTNIAFIDGFRYGKYNSDIRHVQYFNPSLRTLTKHVERKTKFLQALEVFQKHQMEFLMEYLNKTYAGNADFHVHQRKFACELHEDGSVSGYEEIAYNGKEVMVFDREREVYVPVTQEALTMTQQWNQHYDHGNINKLYIENECIPNIKLFLPYLSADLERKVLPKVKISSSESDWERKLHCWVYGFYPRDVEVKWIKNERHEIDSEEAPEILPNPDGTYQIRVSVEVTPEEGATYSCHVDHSSLEEIMVIPFESNDMRIYYIMIPIGAAFFFAFAALGIFVCRKRIRSIYSGHPNLTAETVVLKENSASH